jgi:hypothetical protein
MNRWYGAVSPVCLSARGCNLHLKTGAGFWRGRGNKSLPFLPSKGGGKYIERILGCILVKQGISHECKQGRWIGRRQMTCWTTLFSRPKTRQPVSSSSQKCSSQDRERNCGEAGHSLLSKPVSSRQIPFRSTLKPQPRSSVLEPPSAIGKGNMLQAADVLF